MLASICRRRRPLLALRQISVCGGHGGAKNRIHPNPNSVLLSHVYSLAAVEPNSEPCPTTVSYLVSCGVSPATAAARKIRIQDTDKADAVRRLLREYGFSEAEVTRTVGSDPALLTFDPDRILRPKLDFLIHSLGFRPTVIVLEPHILARSLDKHLVPCTDFLRGILGTEDKLRLAVSHIPRALLMPLDRIAEAFEDLKELGMCPTDNNFLYAFSVMCSLKRETWRRKVALYVSFGVSEDVLIKAFKTQPSILLASEETIKKKVRFYQDALKLELSSLIQHPMALSLSLEKCVKPRCAVLSLLIREGKLERKAKLLPALISNARVFSERFVVKHADDVPDILKAFEGKIKFEGFADRELEFFSSK